MCVFENESIKPPRECDHAEELCSMQSIIKFKLSRQSRAVDSIVTLCVQTSSIQGLTSGRVRYSRLCLVSEDIDWHVRFAKICKQAYAVHFCMPVQCCQAHAVHVCMPAQCCQARAVHVCTPAQCGKRPMLSTKYSLLTQIQLSALLEVYQPLQASRRRQLNRKICSKHKRQLSQLRRSPRSLCRAATVWSLSTTM